MSSVIAPILKPIGNLLMPKAPSAPPPLAPPPPPPTTADAMQAGENAADALRRRRGQAANVLAGLGAGSNQSSVQPLTQAARLLGG